MIPNFNNLLEDKFGIDFDTVGTGPKSKDRKCPSRISLNSGAGWTLKGLRLRDTGLFHAGQTAGCSQPLQGAVRRWARAPGRIARRRREQECEGDKAAEYASGASFIAGWALQQRGDDGRGHGDRDDQGRQRVDVGRDAALDRRIDEDGQRGRAGPGGEETHHEVVEAPAPRWPSSTPWKSTMPATRAKSCCS